MDKNQINRKAIIDSVEHISEFTPEMSMAKTYMLDEMLRKAIRKGATCDAEADVLIEHLDYIIDDAESYFGCCSYEDRAETMYSGDFNYRNE